MSMVFICILLFYTGNDPFIESHEKWNNSFLQRSTLPKIQTIIVHCLQDLRENTGIMGGEDTE